MRIGDITPADVRMGLVWRVGTEWDSLRHRVDEAPVEPASRFVETDYVAYSAVFVTDSKRVLPLLLIKRVGERDYGGDWYMFVDGGWHKIGETPDPNAELGEEFVAYPLDSDPSFDAGDFDHRGFHRNGFREWAPELSHL